MFDFIDKYRAMLLKNIPTYEILIPTSCIPAKESHCSVQEGRITREFSLHGQFVDLYAMGLPIDPPET